VFLVDHVAEEWSLDADGQQVQQDSLPSMYCRYLDTVCMCM